MLSPSDLIPLFLAFLGGLVVARAIDVILADAKDARRATVYTNVAVAGGLSWQLDLSPLVSVAETLVGVSFFTDAFSQLVADMMIGGTVGVLILGAATMADRSGKLGVAAFGIGLFAGWLTPVAPLWGIILYLYGNLVARASPSRGF
jgi:hypothetical protein